MKPTTVIAVASTKGGVGKTTVTALLAAGLHEADVPVHIIDTDPSRNAASWAARYAGVSCESLLIGDDRLRRQVTFENPGPQGTRVVIVDTPPRR